MGVCWLEDCLQETFPLLPEMTLHPETSNSKHHKSGFFCQSTNPPASSVLLTFTLSSPWWKSDALIFTSPTAHMLSNEFIAACPPVAAMYCCTMYFAVEASYMQIGVMNNDGNMISKNRRSSDYVKKKVKPQYKKVWFSCCLYFVYILFLLLILIPNLIRVFP